MEERTFEQLKTVFRSTETSLDDARRAFLEYTARFYNLANRAVDVEGRCVYEPTSTSPGCVHGQHMTKSVLAAIERFSSIDSDSVWLYLKAWHQRLGKDFCCSVQRLHDRSGNWTETGPSYNGRFNADRIRVDFNL